MSVTVADYDSDLQYLRGEVDSLRTDLDRKADDHRVGDLEDRLDHAETTLRRLKHDTRVHEEAIDELRDDLNTEVADVRARHDRAMANIGRRLMWLERHVRATTPQSTALDIDHTLTRLADVAERGRGLQATLLSASTRAAHQAVASADDDLRRQIGEQRAIARQASKTIAVTEPDESGHVIAAATFRAADAATTRLEQQRRDGQDRLASSRAALRENNQRHANHSAEIQAGKRAENDLTTRLRTGLAKAVQDGALMPVWFTTAMGMSSPPDAEQWLAVGVDITIYRATYRVTDPVVALGAAPNATTPAARRSWYQALHARAARYGDLT